MTQAAKIQNSLVTEIANLPYGLGANDCFHPDAGFVDVPPGTPVNIGMGYVDGEFGPPPSPPAPTKDQLKAHAEQVRRNTANGGMNAEGIPIKTDEFTRSRIDSARTAAEADNQYTTTLLGSDGKLYLVAKDDIMAASDAVIAFGSTLADTYADMHQGVDDGTITSFEQINDAFAGVSRTVKDGKQNHYRGSKATS
jgi:hypothetical protein